MPTVSTVGTFELAGEVYAVESHPSEIRVTDVLGEPVVVMPLEAVLRPGAGQELRACVAEVLASAAMQGRGPWVGLDRPLAPR